MKCSIEHTINAIKAIFTQTHTHFTQAYHFAIKCNLAFLFRSFGGGAGKIVQIIC